MKARYKWLISGVFAGAFFGFMQVLMTVKQLGLSIEVNPLAVWERPVGPVILGFASFLIGFSRERLIRHQKETEQKNIDLQRAMLDQSMQLGTELNNTMDELNRYTNRLDKIVNNIDAGLCLINSEYGIEEGFNNAFIKIFGDKNYLHNSIFNSIFSMLDTNLKKEITEFLEQCFTNTTASDSMLSDANPVSDFEYLYLDQGSANVKHITCRIARLKESGGKIEKVLFLFYDMTAEKELEKSLREKEREYNKKYGIIVSLMGNDKDITKQFIQDLEENMKNLGHRIVDLKQNKTNTEVIENILRMVHSVKGEAFSLDFQKLAEEAALFETFLKEKKDNVLDLEMNLEIVNFYERLKSEEAAFGRIIQDLTDFIYGSRETSSVPASTTTESTTEESRPAELESDRDTRPLSLLGKELQVINDKTAKEKGKSVTFSFKSDIEEVSSVTYKLLKDVFLHLIRNSIDHGIRGADEESSGKISISIQKGNGNFLIEYSDNGKGFDVEKIKEKAIEQDLISKESADSMGSADIIKLIFRDGFSTNDDVDMVSGMGVGMSVVKKGIIGQLKGKLNVVNKVNKGILFKMSVPYQETLS